MNAESLLDAFNCLKDFNQYFELNDLKSSYRSFLTRRSIKFGIAYIDRCNQIKFSEGKKICKEYFEKEYPFKIENLFSKSWKYHLSLRFDWFSVLFSRIYKLKKLINIRSV
jgi:hypothetical protein